MNLLNEARDSAKSSARDRACPYWIQRRDPKLYDPITDADADAICYPPGTGRARRDMRIADACAALEKLVRAGDAVAIDGRLLPPVPKDGTRA